MSTESIGENRSLGITPSSAPNGMLQKLALIAKDNPVAILLAGVVTVATTSVGVSSWFFDQRSQFTQAKLERETVVPLRERITDLEFSLRNIERGVGTQKQYLDVARLSIPPDEIPRLDQRYKPLLSGNLFFAAPVDAQGWSYSQASQRDFGMQWLGIDLLASLAGANSDLADFVNEKRGALWVGGSAVEFQPGERATLRMIIDKEQLPLKVKPVVFALPIDQQFLHKAGKGIQQIIASNAGVSDILEKLSKAKSKEPELAEEQTATAPAKADSASIIDLLSKLTDTDLAGFCLMDALVSSTQGAVMLGAASTVLAVEKKGNVFYVRVQLTSQHEGKKFILDQEYFFVGTAKGGVLIRTVIPSVDYQSSAYAWTQAFMAGLRVPLL